jgi:hypothetical protein
VYELNGILARRSPYHLFSPFGHRENLHKNVALKARVHRKCNGIHTKITFNCETSSLSSGGPTRSHTDAKF